MIKVNNKKTIYRVADTAFKADKMRNLFAVIAIVLTTVLFSGLFTIADSLLVSQEESQMRQVGGNAHGGFKYLTMEQYEKLKAHPDIKQISYTVVLASAENAELVKRPTEIRFANDELAAEMHFSLPTTGRMPEKPGEIATDTLVLGRLGIPAELGQKVTLEFSVCGEKYVETFELVGFWEGDIIMSASQAWLARTYVEEILSKYGLNPMEPVPNDRLDTLVGTVNADFFLSNSWNIEKKIIRIIEESGYSPKEMRYGVNWAYTGGNTMDFGTVAGVALVVLLIMFCGYLMISNVFLISVTKDVRFYGMLKTIGTTGKQIKAIIRRQAFMLCLIGVPVGCLAGCLLGGLLTPVILGVLETVVVKVSLHWWVFLFAIVFTVATVFVSISKPSRIAGKISPIEALRSNEGRTELKRKKKRNSGINLWSMALGNVNRNRRKTCLVVASLSLGLIILNAAYTMANGFDMENYLARMISHDFAIGDVSNFSVYSQYYDQDTLSEEFLSGISESEGVESFAKIFFDEMTFPMDEKWEQAVEIIGEEVEMPTMYLDALKNDVQNGIVQHIYGLDDSLWEDLEVLEGSIDLDKLKTGDYVVVLPYAFDEQGHFSVYHVGDKVEMYSRQTEETKVREVIAVADLPYNISIKHSHPGAAEFVLPSSVFLNEIADKAPMLSVLDVEDGQIEEMERYLADYCENVDMNMQYESRATYAKEYENSQRTYKIVGLVLSALLALIGIANFANTNLTSIMTRKRELALLQSIGMTVRQQRGMLIREGAVYTLFTILITCTLGIFLGSYSLNLLFGESPYFEMRFTVAPSLICLPVLLLITCLIPGLCQHYVNQKSVVDRLRENE